MGIRGQRNHSYVGDLTHQYVVGIIGICISGFEGQGGLEVRSEVYLSTTKYINRYNALCKVYVIHISGTKSHDVLNREVIQHPALVKRFEYCPGASCASSVCYLTDWPHIICQRIFLRCR